MRYLRYVFQVLLISGCLLLVGIALFLPEQPDYKFAAIAIAFFGFLFYLTLLLREETESRLNPARTPSSRVFGGFLLVVAIGNFCLAWEVAAGAWRPRSFTLRAISENLHPIGPAVVFALFGLVALRTAWLILRR